MNPHIEEAYQKIKTIFKKRGVLSSFYTFYRMATCPIKHIFHLIPHGKHYVDVGCGYGFISLWTALVFPKAKVVGMDLIPSRIDFANRLAAEANLENLKFLVKDITRDAIARAEIILLIDVFHHIPYEYQLPLLQECIKMVPKGGYIVFKDIGRKPWWKFRINYIQDFLFARQKTYCRDTDEYLEFFKKHGLQPEYFDLRKGYPYSHYFIRARKVN
jgi:2-polyprenyl-3-methyl-5-hydroxy-6-metoxy-1,4-benzoquinol methylase